MNVIITGTSRGIGFELADKFSVTPGFKVIALSRNIEPLNVFNQRNNFRSISFDIGQQENLPALLHMVENFFDGELNILINNAGILIKKPFEEMLASDFDQLFDVNVKGVFLLIQKLMPYFSKPSHIVNTGSMGGVQGSAKFAGLSLYAASKGALSIFSECLAEELKPRKISVNTLAIGAVDTTMQKEAFPQYKASVSAEVMADFIMDFAINGQKVFNGKTLPVSLSTP